MRLQLFYTQVVASSFPCVTFNLSRLPWLLRSLASWPLSVVTRVSAPGTPHWEECDVDVDSSSLCDSLGVIFPCLLAPFYTFARSSPVCSSRKYPNLLYTLPFTCVRYYFFAFFAAPKTIFVQLQVDISLTAGELLKAVGSAAQSWAPSLVTPCLYSSARHPTSLLLRASAVLYFSTFSLC